MSFPAVLKSLLGVDPVPLSIDAIYAELSTICKRDHPAVDSCLITRDGIYAYFGDDAGSGSVSACVIVSVDRESRSQKPASVTVSVSGTARSIDGGIEDSAALIDDAFAFAAFCERKLASWGLL